MSEMVPVDEIDFIPPPPPANDGGGFDDYHTAHFMFSVSMIVAGILALCALPFISFVWHYCKYHQEEEDGDTDCSSVASMIEKQLGKQDEEQPGKDEEPGKASNGG